MKKILFILITAVLIFSVSGCGSSISQEEAKEISDRYITDFTENNYQNMIEGYTMTALVAQAVSEELFQQVWEDNLLLVCGPYVTTDTESAQVSDSSQGYLIIYRLEFEYQYADILVLISKKGEIASFLLQGFESKIERVLPDDLISSDVTFGEEPYSINGSVITSKNTSDGSCVIIIAGSGPNDRYGTLGVNYPYFDLATKLAQDGVTVLIYDKRTYTYANEMSGTDLTISDEVIDDAVYAYQFMSAYDGIDSDKIYFAGHSLGGYVLPMIDAELDETPAGYIFLAAPSTPLEDLMLTQVQYLASLDGSITEDEQANIDLVSVQSENVKTLTEANKDQYTASVLLNAPASYWLSLQSYDPSEAARSINAPMCFIYGGRDYQVPKEESEPYRESLSDRSDTSFWVVSSINHLLYEGSGPPNPGEYYIPSEVSQDVINVILDFIE